MMKVRKNTSIPLFLLLLSVVPCRACDCDNTCSHSVDTVCDDGGVGSEFSLCSLGTDCDDCGERFCDIASPPVAAISQQTQHNKSSPPSYPSSSSSSSSSQSSSKMSPLLILLVVFLSLFVFVCGSFACARYLFDIKLETREVQ
jgi:hypothetical protein